MNLFKLNATYGSSRTPCTLLCAQDGYSDFVWYCVEGSTNVNQCLDDAVYEYVWIEAITDLDHFTTVNPITDLDELETAIEA